MKLCPRCRTSPRERDGRGAYCAPCRNAYQREWRESNRDRVKRHRQSYEQHRAWRGRTLSAKMREAHRLRQRRYYEAHREEILWRQKLRSCGVSRTDEGTRRTPRHQKHRPTSPQLERPAGRSMVAIPPSRPGGAGPSKPVRAERMS